ncbi:Serine/threonine protein phosphatase [Handroanthus impetiginosus]|uniref:Protein phosphatase n=1 Tax=Handroanthus impetiginosus TaxID=429701 RepID=A0A2G9HAP2_9LAMI|nr:Serine/threonine protein phosphatase [Handroanthus impetiginosus]
MDFEPRQSLFMLMGSHYIPKDNPSIPLGEDAHFFSHEAQVIGVADGVGGWASKGIDAGEYARELMRNAAECVYNSRQHDVDPKRVLLEAYKKTRHAEGSSTACIVSLAGDLLRAANLGDSGFIVIRRGKIFYKTEAQQCGFNHPYQIGRRHSKSIGNNPDEAEDIVLVAEVGDVIIVATDGLFDNVFKEDIVTMVEFCLKEKYSPPEVIAYALALAAREKSLQKDTTSPFGVAAREAGVGRHSGGKYDDVTVVVAYVFYASQFG